MYDASIRSNPLMKLNSKSPSKRPASLQPLPLAVYLTGAVGSTFLVSAPQAEAAVTSVTFGFGSVFSASSGLIFTNTPTTPNFGNIYVTATAVPTIYISDFGYIFEPMVRLGDQSSSLGQFYQLGTSIGKASFLANGAIVGSGNNGALGMAYFVSPGNSSRSITTNELNKYLGFKTSTNNWGWANVSWDATAKALTFHSAYVESVAGNTITVGDIGAIPEPSRALLALAGLGAAALRRRRKQAA
jgi:MYXO-CTERM domain-containing protein